MKPKIALIRGKFLTKYDMKPFELLHGKYDITAFGSKTCFSDNFVFPTVKLWSPMDLPDFPYKMQILNRFFIDAHYLLGLENSLKGFDTAHTSETYFNFTHQAIEAKKRGYIRKIICSVFENIPFNNEGIRGRKSFKKHAFANVDHFVAITQGAKDALIREGVSQNKISIVGMGIDTKEFFPKRKRESKNIKILFVGRLEEFKGVFDLVLAFRMLTKDKDLKEFNLSLEIIGKGSKREKIERFMEESNLSKQIKIGALPYSSLPDKYRRSDIFVAPSKKDKYWKEQFGMVFLEAMASGLPVVSYSSGSISEVVGEAGILAKEGDVNLLTRHIKELILNKKLREELGAKGRQRVMQKFNIGIVSKKMSEIYRNL